MYLAGLIDRENWLNPFLCILFLTIFKGVHKKKERMGKNMRDYKEKWVIMI